MNEQKQDDQLEPIYNCSVPIQDVALKTYREQWTIEMDGGRRSGRSVLAVRHDNDDDDVSWVAGNRDSCLGRHGFKPSTRLGWTRALIVSTRGKSGSSSIKGKTEVKANLFLFPAYVSPLLPVRGFCI